MPNVVAKFTTPGSSAGAGAEALRAEGLSDFTTFYIGSTTGSLEVFVSLDGVNLSTSPLALFDQHALDNLPVAATAAGKVYAFIGPYSMVVAKQVGGTAVANAVLKAR